jgi:hypothetical protein
MEIKGLKWDKMTRHINLERHKLATKAKHVTDATVIISKDVIQNAMNMTCTTFFIIKSAFS